MYPIPGGKVEKRASPSSSTVLILPNDHGHFDVGQFEFKAHKIINVKNGISIKLYQKESF